MVDQNTYYLSQASAVCSSSMSSSNVHLIIETSLKTSSYEMDLFLKRLIESLIKSRWENSIMWDFMHLHLLFSMVENATLYLVSIKSYWKKYSFTFFCNERRYNHVTCEQSSSYRNCVITTLVEVWLNSIEKYSFLVSIKLYGEKVS